MRRFAELLALLIVVIAGLAGAAMWWVQEQYEAPGPSTRDTVLVVERGSSVSAIARQLADAGVIRDDRLFLVAVRLFGEGEPLRAGEYQFPAGISSQGAAAMLAGGPTVEHRLTVAEGLTSAEIVALVAMAEGLEGDVPAEPPADGALLPETYFFAKGDRRADLVDRMDKAMRETIAELWPNRAAGLPLQSPAEAIVLASIVEKETALESERSRVAAVFYNRLKKGMPLQSDPTVIYAITGGKAKLERGLTYADLEIESPYNTYHSPGLPPGPIANPGRASIEAVLHPLTTDELYFVANGAGGHVFAKTLDEHNRNVANWRKIQKRQAKQNEAAEESETQSQ